MNDEQILTALEELAYDIWKICDHFFFADDYVFQNLTLDDKSDKISDFIYKIDQLSLKKKKSIDFKIIKEALGE